MNRMITLIGALGVMFCAIPAYASGGFGENSVGSGWNKQGDARSVERPHAQSPAHAHKSGRYARADRRKTRSHASLRTRRSVHVARSSEQARMSKPQRIASARRGRGTAGGHEQRPRSEGITSLFGSLQTGIASHYWEPQRLASGGWFNPTAMTAAHRTLPFGTKVRVTNVRNGKSVDVTINDRGPYVGGRIIDLSSGAAGVIGMKEAGLAKVQLQVLGR